MTARDVVWEPYGYYANRSNVARFVDQYGYDDYADLRPETIEEIADFWEHVDDDLGIVWDEPYDQVLDTSDGTPFAEWFVGGRLNATRTLLDRWVDRQPDVTAYVWENEAGDVERVSYAELERRTDRLANALREAGIGRGDAVGIVFPLHPAAMVASLACLKVGAVQTQVFAGYGAPAIADRLADCEAELVFTADGYRREGSEIDLTDKVDAAIADAPSVETAVTYDNRGLEGGITSVETVAWETFVADQPETAEATVVGAEEPALIAYSSGTTGEPKGTVHTQASMLLNGMKEAAYQFDCSPGDAFCWITDFGWIVVPAWITFGAQALGATSVLIGGSPMAPDDERIWELVDEYDVTTLGMSPTGARQLREANPTPREDHSLASLRILGSSGEPWDDETWNWFFEAVGEGDLPIINDSGGTEAAGGLLAPTPLTPLKPTTLWGPAPGIPADVYDEDGEPAREGYLVVEGPFAGMSRSLTGGDERYLDAYWRDFEGVWNQNDWVEIDDDGFWFISGRADDTMNVSGRRITAPELEGVLVLHPAVSDAAVIPVPDATRGQVPVGFVTIADDADPPDDLTAAVNEVVSTELGAPYRLDTVHRVGALPRTQTGKIPRSVLETSYLEAVPADTSTLDGSEVLERIREFGEQS
jgi:acetyl-CoA synthetase